VLARVGSGRDQTWSAEWATSASSVAAQLGHLRVRVGPGRNAANGDAEVGPPKAVVRTLVVTAREDIEIARQVRELLA
jgi:acetate kinase